MRYPQTLLISCEIPWDERERFLEDVFRAEVRAMAGKGFLDQYVFGTAGEGYAVDTARFRHIVRVFGEEARALGLRAMVGVIGLSTANVVERIAVAHDEGFRAFQISLPSWGALNDVEVMTFFRDVCAAFPDARFLHYNLPRAKRVLSGADYRRLIDAVPNLAATKNTGGGIDRAADLMKHAPELQHFFGEMNFPHGILLGECSLLSSFGPMAPNRSRALFEAGLARNVARLFELQRDFHAMTRDVFGELLKRERIDGAYDKMIVRLAGLPGFPLRLLSPYQAFSDEEFDAARRAFEERWAAWEASG